MTQTTEVAERAETQLEILRKEFEAGERRLAELERQRTQLTETMLRISGAIQVLEDVLGQSEAEPAAEDGAADQS
ncbi:MAG TPA: hypothetical protein VGF23_14205 [Gaiellaceae bacterium]|jgi:hypothetical protein